MKNFVVKNGGELLFSFLFICLFNFPKIAPLALVLSIIYYIVLGFKRDLKFHVSGLGLGFVALYLAYGIGIFWTRDIATATFYLENKLSFILMPLAFGFSKKSGFNLPLILKGLITAIVLSFAWNIFRAIPCYLEYYSFPWCFMKSHLSPIVHPTYMTAGVQIALVSLFWLNMRGYLKNWLLIVLGIVFSIYIFLLLSLSGVLFFVATASIYGLYKLTQGRSKKFITIVSVGFVIGFVGLFSTKYLRMEMKEVQTYVGSFINSKEAYIASFPKENASSSQVRIMLWLAAIEEIQKHPFGVGTANVDEHMGTNLRSKGLNELASYNYNPHNQYLHIWLEIGIIGLTLFLFILFFGLRLGIKKKNWVLIFVICNLAFNCLFESMLQKQSGIMFYPLILMILLISISSEKKEIHE